MFWNHFFLLIPLFSFCSISSFLFLYFITQRASFSNNFLSFVTTCFQIHMKTYKSVMYFPWVKYKHLFLFFVLYNFFRWRKTPYVFDGIHSGIWTRITVENNVRKFTEVLSSLKGDLTAGEQWLFHLIYVGGKRSSCVQNVTNLGIQASEKNALRFITWCY